MTDRMFTDYARQHSSQLIKFENCLTIDAELVKLMRAYLDWIGGVDFEKVSCRSKFIVLSGTLMCYLRTGVVLKKRNQIWWILGMAGQLFDGLIRETKANVLIDLFLEMLTDRKPIVEKFVKIRITQRMKKLRQVI